MINSSYIRSIRQKSRNPEHDDFVYGKKKKVLFLESISNLGLIIKTESNSSRFINEIKQLFLVYLISVFIRNIVVYIHTKNVKQINLLTLFLLQHICFI